MKFKEERLIINTSQSLIRFNASGQIFQKMVVNRIMAHICPCRWLNKLILTEIVSRTQAQKEIPMMWMKLSCLASNL